MTMVSSIELPELNCGLCGYRTCDELRAQLEMHPEMRDRCIHLSENGAAAMLRKQGESVPGCASACASCHSGGTGIHAYQTGTPWQDSLGREFDFYLEHFPEDAGPREIILPHNPMVTRELDVRVGDILIGRPLGMSCGCPITHCGVAVEVDQRNGVMTWCVTGPLGPRQHGYKDLGYYIAEGYEGLVKDTRREMRIGERYFFQPRMCMLQWRHSGLLNYLNHTPDGYQVRLEGLFIG